MTFVRILCAPAFSLKLALPACLLGQRGRVRSLGRLDRYWLSRIVNRYLEYRLSAGKDWLDWSASVYLECRLWNTTLQEFRERIKLLLDTLQASSVNGSFNVGLLDKVIEIVVSSVIATLLHVVIVEATVLLRLHVLIGVSDVR